MSTLLRQIELLKVEIDRLRPLRKDLVALLREKLRIEWTYNSNALEGNTLTLGETAFFLREGLTSEGRPLRDYLEAKNHAEALDGLEEIVARKRPITESMIKELHAVLMRDVPMQAGRYKSRPNHVLTLSGKVHSYCDPLHVRDEMEKLVAWSATKIHTVEKAALFHYRFVAIHPFDDGNGRLARILMNLILIKDGYPPCIIRNAQRKKYLQSLERADQTRELRPFAEFVMEELLVTMQSVREVLKGKESLGVPHQKKTLNREEREALILDHLAGPPQSIQQLVARLPDIKRPTLKSDLSRMVSDRRIRKKGVKKGTVYFRR